MMNLLQIRVLAAAACVLAVVTLTSQTQADGIICQLDDYISKLDLSTEPNVSGVEVVANRAYVGSAASSLTTGILTVINVSDTGAPLIVASNQMPFGIRDIHVSGTTAYLVDYQFGLYVVDLTVETDPQILAGFFTTGNPRSVELAGTTAYLAAESAGVLIIDASDPTDLKQLGHIPSQSAVSVSIDGHIAYIADDEVGLRIFDISDPASPMLLAEIESVGNTRDVCVSGDMAYIAAGNAAASQLEIIDVSDPANPTPIGSQPSIITSRSVSVYGDYAFINARDAGVLKYDVSDPSNPRLLNTYSISQRQFLYGFTTHEDLVFALYRGIETGSELRIIDPSEDRQIYYASHNAPLPNQKVRIRDGIAYLAAEDAFQTFDISNPEMPVLLDNFLQVSLARGITLHENFAFVSAGGSVRILDISDPANVISRGSLSTPGNNESGVVAGDKLYIAGGERGGLHIFDISNLETAPSSLGQLLTDGQARDVAVKGTVAYLADSLTPRYGGTPGLRVIDVSDPSAPTLISHDISDQLVALEVIGNTLFATGTSRIFIFDISTPTAPVLISTAVFNDGGMPWDLEVEGDFAYIADGYDGVAVMDISDKLNPAQVASTFVPTFSRGLSVSDGVLCVADYWGGLHVLNASQCATCAADLNADGTLDSFDVSAFLNAYNAQDPVADLNQDALYNFFDISEFLTSFLSGCP